MQLLVDQQLVSSFKDTRWVTGTVGVAPSCRSVEVSDIKVGLPSVSVILIQTISKIHAFALIPYCLNQYQEKVKSFVFLWVLDQQLYVTILAKFFLLNLFLTW